MKFVLSLLVICVVNSALSSEQQSQVHDKLTDAEVKTIFRRERRDVPSYTFVDIKSKSAHRSKRDLRPIEFEVDGKKTELNLRPVHRSVMARSIPVWCAKSKAGRPYNYKALGKDEKRINGIFYEDPKNAATLLGYVKDGHIYYDGVFGESADKKVVKAAPHEWRRLEPNVNGGNHFVFNVSSHGKFVPIEQHEIDSVEHKLDKPLDTFYPKLLVVVDYSLFETLSKDVQETVKYMSTLWNAVQLKYSQIEKPKIKIMVTGLIISEDPAAVEYIYKSRDETDMRKFNPYNMLLRAGDYFRDEFYAATNFDNYDAIITMANLDSGSTLGSAYGGTICEHKYNVGYVIDDGNYAAVHRAVHELGHLLSLIHDKQSNECEDYPEDKLGSVMAAAEYGVKERFWSQCSQKALQKFAWSKRSVCLKNTFRHRNHK